MSAYVPRPIPKYDNILAARWYCLDCKEDRMGEASMKSHWESAHGEDGEKAANGVDYANGTQLIVLMARREEWIDQEAKKFYEEMHRGFGPDDFVAEAEIRSA